MSKGTTLRNVRVPDDLWDAAQDRAQAEDRTLSDIVRQALIDYVAAQNTTPNGDRNDHH